MAKKQLIDSNIEPGDSVELPEETTPVQIRVHSVNPAELLPDVRVGALSMSQPIDQLAAALAKASRVIENPPKDKTAKVFSKRTNSSFSYAYSDLATVLNTVKKPLADQGLSLVHGVATDGMRVEVTALLLHSSGQWLSASVSWLPEEGTGVQGAGSVITYLRRYTAQGLAGVTAEEDNDAAPEREAAEHRAADLQSKRNEVAKQAYAPRPAPPAAPIKGTPGSAQWRANYVKYVAELKTKIGNAAYYRILGTHGLEKADEVRSYEEARKLVHALEAEVKAVGTHPAPAGTEYNSELGTVQPKLEPEPEDVLMEEQGYLGSE